MIHEDITLGPVRLIRGDCTLIAPTLEGVDAVITDPPYGVKNNMGTGRMSKVGSAIHGDEYPPDIHWIGLVKHAVVWGGNNFCDQLPRSTGWLVWDKTHAETCEHSQAEIAWTNTVRTVRIHREAYHGFMRKIDGWMHPHQKPPALVAWSMQWTPVESIILDPYMGSGTTLIAAIRTGRRAIGIEIDERHFRTAVERVKRELAQPMLPATAPQKAEQQDLIA